MASKTAPKAKPAKSAPAPVAGPPPEVECRDEGRSLFYQRVGRYFYDEADVARFDAPRTCSQCGKPIEVGMLDGERVLCGAQRSLAQFRLSWKEREEVEAGTRDPKKRGYSAFVAKKKGFLITADFADVITAVAPTKPLPASLTWYRDGTSPNWVAVLGRLLQPIRGPVLFAEFNQNASAPLIPSADVNVVLRCGGDRTVPVDVARVREIMEAGRALGTEDLHRLAVLRDRRLREQAMPDKDKKAFLELMGRFRAGGLGDAYPPSVGEDAYGYALKLLGVAEA